MKHLIMGTAGHVDHGKTALVKALTGFDCDTHPEEKRRGITINLGFTHLKTNKGKIGIVDVPGHKDFIHTMVAGACGIDFALFVVASDGGVMPQTREHLEIMNLLGVKKGIIVLTRSDLASRDVADLAKEEVKGLVKGTFLEGAPIVSTSIVTDDGICELKEEIEKIAERVEERPAGGVFRIFVDRIFSVKGFGTVVNGSVISGRLRVKDSVYLIPSGGGELRVRRLERDREEVTEVVAGDRASLNLVGLNREDFKRGQVISNQELPVTELIDSKLQLFGGFHGLDLWSNVIFHLGTFESPAKVHLLSGNLAQIHLDRPCVIMRGDRFIIRNSSCDTTLGGGEVIDPFPLHHRRRTPQLIDNIQRIADGKLSELIAFEVKKERGPISTGEMSSYLNLPHDDIKRAVKEMSSGVTIYDCGDEFVLVPEDEDEKIKSRIVETLSSLHKRNPLDKKGRCEHEFKGILGLRTKAGEKLIGAICERLKREGVIKNVEDTWALAGHNVALDSDFKRRIDDVERMLIEYDMQTPLFSELKEKTKLGEDGLKQVLHFLIGEKRAYYINENYIHASVVDRSRKKLVETLKGGKDGITVAEFRDIVSGNRKISLLLLAIFDREGTTIRAGDKRYLKNKL